MASFFDKLTDTEAMKFIDQINAPFKTLPHIPEGFINFFVTLAPWMALLSGILSGLGGIFGIIGSLTSLLSLSPIIIVSTVLSTALMLIQAVLMLMSFTPLKERELKGWIFMFWSNMIGIAQMIVGLAVGGTSGLVFSIVGVLIGLYVLFEMRSKYDPALALAKKSDGKKSDEK